MKKMMVAAFAAMVGILTASASQTTWGFLEDDVLGADGNAFRSGTALLFVVNDLSSAPVFENGAWNMNGAVLADSIGYDVDYGGWGREQWTNLSAVNSGATAGVAQQYFSIILTEGVGVTDLSTYEGNYVYAFEKQGVQKVYSSTDPVEYGTKVENWGVEIAQGDWQTASIPEPTSGLLLLLGVGALALRRRRA